MFTWGSEHLVAGAVLTIRMCGNSARRAMINGKTTLCAVCRIGLENTHSSEIENMQSTFFKAMKPDPWRLGTVSEEVS